LKESTEEFFNKFKDVRKHFIDKKGVKEEEDIVARVKVVIDECETVFENAPLTSVKTDGVSKDEVLVLKEKINAILSSIPDRALAGMLKSWHYFRLERSTFWKSVSDKYVVDTDILNDTIHPVTNTQGGRVTKNLEKLEVFVANLRIYLDGDCLSADKHKVEIALDYEIEITLRMCKALLVDTKCD
jgi:hypothetical protein